MREEEDQFRKSLKFLIVVGLAWLFAIILLLARAKLAHAHDRLHPDLDNWYGGLTRPGVSHDWPAASCCSKTDCHTTDAELRQGEWWARIGTRKTDGDWELRDWVRVPADRVLERHDNPTGEAVICHKIAWRLDGQTLAAQASEVWCFVPASES